MSQCPSSTLANWRKLPDELKVHILGYLVPTGGQYSAQDFVKWTNMSLCHEVWNVVMPLLSCPEIFNFVVELFWGQNTMCIHKRRAHKSKRSTVLYPPHYSWVYLRRLRLSLGDGALDEGALQDVARAIRDFPHLRHLTLIINDRKYGRGLALLTPPGPPAVAFSTHMLEVEYHHTNVFYNEAYNGALSQGDPVEEPLLNSLSIAGAGGLDVVETWMRYQWAGCIGEGEHVDVWPSGYWRKRMTRKIVEIK
jgi:hypothetical protein